MPSKVLDPPRLHFLCPQANSAILNALLTLLNERAFDDGALRLPAPLLCAVGAANELPESEDLDALYPHAAPPQCGACSLPQGRFIHRPKILSPCQNLNI